MRVLPVRALSALVVLLFASSASAVTMAWAPIGNPGNPADTQVMDTDSTTGYGSVPYTYSIGTYEVTTAQYTEFLNAKAKSDPRFLYNSGMAVDRTGGITRSGSSGSYTYSTIAGRENMPVNYVSFYDALRFANWMNNGQGNGDTETGSYTLLGGNATPSNGDTVARNANAAIVLPTENEWYKAAYYNPNTASYFDFPTASDTPTTCSVPSTLANHANCNDAVFYNNAYNLTIAGGYAGSASPYGTFDQGGNVLELNEAIPVSSNRGMRGGWFGNFPYYLAAYDREWVAPYFESNAIGFRLAMIPEPSTGLLVVAGLVAFAARRRVGA
jgi:formylglycine-generating enzyme